MRWYEVQARRSAEGRITLPAAPLTMRVSWHRWSAFAGLGDEIRVQYVTLHPAPLPTDNRLFVRIGPGRCLAQAQFTIDQGVQNMPWCLE